MCGDGGWVRGGKGRLTEAGNCPVYFNLVSPVVRNLRCEVGTALGLEDDPSQTFNWTSKAEQCHPGELCQETVMLIKAGKGDCSGPVVGGSTGCPEFCSCREHVQD